MKSQRDRETLRHVRELGVARPRDLPERLRGRLNALCGAGHLDRIARGVYVIARADLSEHSDLAIVSRVVPNATVCLLSALSYHLLTTQLPRGVWIAIDNKAHPPKLPSTRLHIVRMTGASLSLGAEVHEVDGVQVRVFSPAKTVADCFKFRSRVGLDVALEALREYARLHRGLMDELWGHAATCRVRGVLRPYLETLR